MAYKRKKITKKMLKDGQGEIAPLNAIQEKGQWILKYTEKDDPNTIRTEHFDSRQDMENVLKEVGAKNLFTVTTKDMFTELSDWTNEDLIACGHQIKQLNVDGKVSIYSNTVPIFADKKCGMPRDDNKNYTSDAIFNINVRSKHLKECRITRIFKNGKEFDNLLAIIAKDSAFAEFKNASAFKVRRLVTKNIKTGQICSWRRTSAQNGTSKMLLQLQKVDGVHYRKMIRSEVFAAAGKLMDMVCELNPLPDVVLREENVCKIYAQSIAE